ncbi:MAG: hypothetical protein ACJ71W_21680 [Terriglobales bacterium]
MATDTVNLPAGFVLENNPTPAPQTQGQSSPNLPPGFQLEDQNTAQPDQQAQDQSANDARPFWRKLLGLAPEATTPQDKTKEDAFWADQKQRMAGALTDDYQAKADPLIGIGKAAGQTAIDTDNLVRHGLNKVGGDYQDIETPDALQLHGEGQHMGAVAENVLEFVLGDEALKSLSLADKLGKAAKIAKVMEENPYLTKMIGTGLRQGTVSGAQTALHGGDAGDIAKSALIGGTLGGTFEGASGLLEKGLANRAAASGVQDTANEFSVPLSAGQSTTGAVTQATEAALKKVPFVNAPFNKLGAAQNDAIKSAADEIANSIGSKAASGTAAGEDIQNAIGKAKNTAGKSYADAQQQISDAGAAQLPVPLKGTIADTAQKMLDNIQLPDELSAGVKDVQGRQAAVDVLKNLANDTAADGTPRSMTWEQARRLKSQLFDLANSGDSNVGTGAIKQMTGALDKSMQDTLVGAGKADLADQFSQASNHYRSINDALDTSIVKRLSSSDPIDVGKFLVNNVSPNTINTLKQVAPAQMPQIQRGVWEELFNRALNNPDGVVAGKVLQKEFQKLGPETASALWNPAQLQKISRFVDLVGKVGLTPKAASTTVGGLGEAGLLGWHVVHGGLLLGGLKTGGTLLTARGLSKVMTSPGGIETVTKVLNASQKGMNNPTAKQALIGLINFATSQHTNDLKKE